MNKLTSIKFIKCKDHFKCDILKYIFYKSWIYSSIRSKSAIYDYIQNARIFGSPYLATFRKVKKGKNLPVLPFNQLSMICGLRYSAVLAIIKKKSCLSWKRERTSGEKNHISYMFTTRFCW